MAVSITISPAGTIPTSEIQQTTRSARSVNALITASGDMGEIIQSVTATIDISEPGVSITSATNSVSIIGTYKDPFEDYLTYIERGSSNLIESPKVAKGISNLPPNKDFYELSQDQRRLFTRTYTVLVQTNLSTSQFTVTHDILNNLDGITTFVGSYYN
jgi:hypothetical protein